MAELLNRLLTALVGMTILLIAAGMLDLPNNPARLILDHLLGGL